MLQRQDGRKLYVIIKTMWFPGFHHNGFVVTHEFCVDRTSCAQAHESPQSHCGDNWEGTLLL